MIRAVSFKSEEKSYHGFLEGATPGSTVNPGRNIVSPGDVEYARAHSITIGGNRGRNIVVSEEVKGLQIAPDVIEFFNNLGEKLSRLLKIGKK